MWNDADFLDRLAKNASDPGVRAVAGYLVSARREAPAPPLFRRLESAAAAPDTPWFGWIGEDDVIAPDAARRLNEAARDCAFDAIYADDILGADEDAVFRAKPAFDPILLARSDYIGRAAIFHRDALSGEDRAALASGLPPAALLRSRPELRVGHLPYPALISRAAPEPPPLSEPPAGPRPPVSVIIPNRDSPDLIRRVLAGLLTATDYPELEVVVIDNGSTNAETLATYRAHQDDPRFRAEIRPAPFNFSAMVNSGVALARRETVLLLNNDIEVTRPDWLARMVDTLHQPAALAGGEVGVVGAKLLFPDRSIQHAGVIVGHGGVAGHDMKGAPETTVDPLGRLTLPHSRSAVTAAALLTTKTLWKALGGFDETAFPVAFNDVDFCLRAQAAGRRVALAPDAVLIHHEGKSRKKGVSLRRWLAHRGERTALRARHGSQRHVDRYENPWRDHDALIPVYRPPLGEIKLR